MGALVVVFCHVKSDLLLSKRIVCVFDRISSFCLFFSVLFFCCVRFSLLCVCSLFYDVVMV